MHADRLAKRLDHVGPLRFWRYLQDEGEEEGLRWHEGDMSQHLPQEITASPIFSLLISTTNIPHDTTLIYIYIYLYRYTSYDTSLWRLCLEISQDIMVKSSFPTDVILGTRPKRGTNSKDLPMAGLQDGDRLAGLAALSIASFWTHKKDLSWRSILIHISNPFQ